NFQVGGTANSLAFQRKVWILSKFGFLNKSQILDFLRRTLATDLVKKNVPIQEVAEILGHADLRTTQVYVCLGQESVKYHYNKAIA
ncbi:hypothetical protein D3Z53_24420, partial [Lachnospiraceae bacterium]|nr:hypothetical protein [Lachnospiraceae bacterium]